MAKFVEAVKRVFGSSNDRQLKRGRPLLQRINGLESGFQALDDVTLRNKTLEFKQRLAAGEPLQNLIPEAFSVVREAAVRTLGLRHFDVQILGGLILHQGSIAEMKTGEGKTLVATLPAYLNALEGNGVHVVTVNDYLAKRDAEWMGEVYGFLGLRTGCVVPGLDDSARREAYEADVTYATNNELGFDYLRDNMKHSLESMVQRGHHYAIVDEVDSILIDEARTPLIISGPTEDRTALYLAVDDLIPSLNESHYEIDEKLRTATISEEGNELLEEKLSQMELLQHGTLYDAENAALVHHLNQALRAHKLFQRDRDYIVRNNGVTIIDEFTGRMMEGRRYGDGLHQAIEAKEGVVIQPENVTLASITFQNYFRLYHKLAGMTGTAMTEAEEFQEIYGLLTVDVPTNMPMIREDEDDQVFRTLDEKIEAIVESISDARNRGQPALVGTTSIERSELLSAKLKQMGVPHNVLNARYHEQEAEIVAQAGAPGAVTIATNMAGRGTDIQLGGNLDRKMASELTAVEDPNKVKEIAERVRREMKEARDKVVKAGGLWIIGTERHESRRIDNQLRGRSGRQGDPGRSTFFLSLEDDLMRIFGSERMDSMLVRLGLEQGEAIVHPWVNKAVEKAQTKVEARNFDVRKNLLKYDDVMNDQRKIVFGQRRELMEVTDVGAVIGEMKEEVVDQLVDEHVPERSYVEKWNIDGLSASLRSVFGRTMDVKKWVEEEGVDDDELRDRIHGAVDVLVEGRKSEFGENIARDIGRTLVLRTIDGLWREHLGTLDHLRSVVGLRGYAQRNPLNEYKSEAFTLFEGMLDRLRREVVRQFMHVQLVREPDVDRSEKSQPDETVASHPTTQAIGQPSATNVTTGTKQSQPTYAPEAGKVGRNDQCPCGSGKKYKKCCGS